MSYAGSSSPKGRKNQQKCKFEFEVTYLPHQPQVFDSPARNVVYVKGRRAGGTHGAVNRLIELAHEQPGTRHLWVDTVHRNILRYLRRYFLPGLRGTRYRWDGQQKTLTFETGAYCDFGSAQRPENIEGFAYEYIWINEAGTVLKEEALFYHTLLPMVMEARQAQIFLIGSPKGPGLFQKMFDWGQDDFHPEWESFRHPSRINLNLDRQVLREMRDNMTERTFRQEVEAEFLESEGAVFREVDAMARLVPEGEPDPGAPYVLGVDLARHRDFTAVWAGRADRVEGVDCQRFHRMSWQQQTERIRNLSRHYGNAPLFVDATGAGQSVCEDLIRMGLHVQGVNFTAQSKRCLIDHLAIGIERGALAIVPHQQTLRELKAYEYRVLPSGHPRSEGAGGEHDDCVIALALCYWGMTSRGLGFLLGPKMVTSELD